MSSLSQVNQAANLAGNMGSFVQGLSGVNTVQEESTGRLSKTVAWLRSSTAKKVLAVVLAFLLALTVVGVIPLVLAAKEWKIQNNADARKDEIEKVKELTKAFDDLRYTKGDKELGALYE